MGHVRKERGRYRARYRDPLGRSQSKTFTRKADAERFVREVELDKQRGNWIDPRDGDLPLAVWADTFLSLARRLSPTTQDTYRRDLERYILPRFGSYRLSRLPAEEIEQWLNDEVAEGIAASSVHRHYRTLRRMLAVAVQKQKILHNACDRVDPPRVPRRGDDVPQLGSVDPLGGGPQRTLPSDDLRRSRHRHALGRVDRTAPRQRRRQPLQDPGHGTARPADRSKLCTAASEDSSGAAVNHRLTLHRRRPLRTSGAECEPRSGRTRVPEFSRQPIVCVKLPIPPFRQGSATRGRVLSLSRLRHTSVALAIAAGAHPKAIQARMGHASINVTLDRYGHLLPELDEAIAQTFGRELDEAYRRRASNVIHAAFGGDEHH